MTKVISAADAARLIPDDAVVSVSSSSGLGCPDLMLKAIGERFAATGHPRGLTTLHPIAAGDMSGIKGVDHIAKPGLLKRILAGSYPSGPSSAEPPLIWQMITGNAIPAYNIPSGILFDMHREAAAKRMALLRQYLAGESPPQFFLGCYYGWPRQHPDPTNVAVSLPTPTSCTSVALRIG